MGGGGGGPAAVTLSLDANAAVDGQTFQKLWGELATSATLQVSEQKMEMSE